MCSSDLLSIRVTHGVMFLGMNKGRCCDKLSCVVAIVICAKKDSQGSCMRWTGNMSKNRLTKACVYIPDWYYVPLSQNK